MPTKEEREARNERERQRYAALSQEEKDALLDRHAKWTEARKEKNPDAHEEATRNKVANQRERYRTDPVYREQVKAYQRGAARERRKRAKEAKGK